jgi:GMP synthase-like glutamine amidotransferase
MWIYVVVQEKEGYYRDGATGGQVKARLEAASGERCLVVPYQEFGPEVVAELAPNAIAMSGFGGHWHDRDPAWFAGMDAVVRTADVPIIGFCGSHQLLGFAFDGAIARRERVRDQPMRALAPGEDLPRSPSASYGMPGYDLSGHFVAEGFYPIRRVADDPIFDGLPEVMHLRCSHYCEVKSLPPGFRLLASSAHCRIEMMRHGERPIYGTQFHPEAFAAPWFDGQRLLANFARIVATKPQVPA